MAFFASKEKNRRQIQERYLLIENIWTENITSRLIPPLFVNVSGQRWGVDGSPQGYCLSYDTHVFCANQTPAHGQASASQKKKLPFYSQSDPDASHSRYRIALGCLSRHWRHRCFQRTHPTQSEGDVCVCFDHRELRDW